MSKTKNKFDFTVDELVRRATEKGLLIEVGWLGLKKTCINPYASQKQLQEMRSIFFAGAQHLWGSIMSVMDAMDVGEEPTEADLKRMDLIDKELRTWLDEYKPMEE